MLQDEKAFMEENPTTILGINGHRCKLISLEENKIVRYIKYGLLIIVLVVLLVVINLGVIFF